MRQSLIICDNRRGMNINDLKIFKAVLRHRSFTNAAAEMHMVQPNVTAWIKLLEEEFGKV